MAVMTIGMIGRREIVVEPRHIGEANLLAGNPYLSNPWLTLFCEVACDEAIRPGFADGEASVGTHVALTHEAQAGVGRTVRFEAKVASIQDRHVHFDVVGMVGERVVVQGTHDRVVVELERFLARLPKP